MELKEGRAWPMKSIIYRCNCRKLWSIQNRKRKQTAQSILLIGDWTTEIKPERSRNPKGFVATTESRKLVLNPSIELIEKYIKITKLMYNPADVSFNIISGRNLYFTEEGACFLLKEK